MKRRTMKKRYDIFVGIDEVGRGPLAGPLVVSAFLVKKEHEEFVFSSLVGIRDSKKLSPQKRSDFFQKMYELKKRAFLDIFISSISAKEIDCEGLSTSLKKALRDLLKKIRKKYPKERIFYFLDGSLYLEEEEHQETLIRGDEKNLYISAASVYAKVYRDRKMINYAKKYPNYAFEKHFIVSRLRNMDHAIFIEKLG